MITISHIRVVPTYQPMVPMRFLPYPAGCSSPILIAMYLFLFLSIHTVLFVNLVSVSFFACFSIFNMLRLPFCDSFYPLVIFQFCEMTHTFPYLSNFSFIIHICSSYQYFEIFYNQSFEIYQPVKQKILKISNSTTPKSLKLQFDKTK